MCKNIDIYIKIKEIKTSQTTENLIENNILTFASALANYDIKLTVA